MTMIIMTTTMITRHLLGTTTANGGGRSLEKGRVTYWMVISTWTSLKEILNQRRNQESNHFRCIVTRFENVKSLLTKRI